MFSFTKIFLVSKSGIFPSRLSTLKHMVADLEVGGKTKFVVNNMKASTLYRTED